MAVVIFARTLSRSTARPAYQLGLILILMLVSTAVLAAGGSDLPNLRALARHAKVSALVVRLSDMHTIAAINPDERLTPASTSKLFATAAALEQFGPAHRFTSRFTSQGIVRSHTLEGNLVFVGGGDPSLDTRHLRELVARLKARGIDRVTGDLVIDNGLWGTVPCLTQDRCDAESRASHAYSAPLSAAGVNFGTVTGAIYPGGTRGASTQVRLDPLGLSGYALDNQMRTVARGGPTSVSVWRTTDSSGSTLHLRGTLPLGAAPYRFQRAVTGATAATGRVLSALLASAGVQIAGNLVLRSSDVNSQGQNLAEVKSTSLAEQLIPMLAYSNNYMADTLTLDVAANSGYNLPLTLPRAAQALHALSRQADHFAYPKIASDGATFTSGSGLSLGNSVSARDLVSLLAYMYHQNALFPSFYGAIPVPLSAPSKTLKRGDFAFETRLVAKTGTLSQPVTVRSLAGYMRLSDGSFAAYGIIINGTPNNQNLTYQQTVTAYQHDLENVLSAY